MDGGVLAASAQIDQLVGSPDGGNDRAADGAIGANLGLERAQQQAHQLALSILRPQRGASQDALPRALDPEEEAESFDQSTRNHAIFHGTARPTRSRGS